ncbi:WD domain G-beta repeat [Carpediemonas membranifera]|uniref:WD domain G-beta repeat n=1 Tax=Carpediemonas membranifera TaxID=201153 RepID=A0A8J6ASV2_9EUKA|nr:WD domain G-beta repeat [Carpediemonas membranifera]|eukprot:KAG9393223.1 WD domain G-beta repeat [Carpediemonas membranifera]
MAWTKVAMMGKTPLTLMILATASDDGTVKLWAVQHIASGGFEQTPSTPPSLVLVHTVQVTPTADAVTTVALADMVSENKKIRIIAGTAGGVVALLSCTIDANPSAISGFSAFLEPHGTVHAHAGIVSSVSFVGCLDLAMSSGHDGTIRTWATLAGRGPNAKRELVERAEVICPRRCPPVSSMLVPHNGLTMLVSTMDRPATLRLFNRANMRKGDDSSRPQDIPAQGMAVWRQLPRRMYTGHVMDVFPCRAVACGIGDLKLIAVGTDDGHVVFYSASQGAPTTPVKTLTVVDPESLTQTERAEAEKASDRAGALMMTAVTSLDMIEADRMVVNRPLKRLVLAVANPRLVNGCGQALLYFIQKAE